MQTCVTRKEKGSNLLEAKPVQGMILLWFSLLQSYTKYQGAGQSYKDLCDLQLNKICLSCMEKETTLLTRAYTEPAQ